MRIPRPVAARFRLVFALTSLLLAPGAFAETEQVIQREAPLGNGFLGYETDRFVVVYKPETAGQLQALPALPERARANLERVQQVLDRVAAKDFAREFANARAEGPGSRRVDLTGYYLVRLAPGMGLDEAMAEFKKQPDVDHVEKIGIHTVFLEPNDTYYKFGTASFPHDQWHYYGPFGINANAAWTVERGSPQVLVGI